MFIQLLGSSIASPGVGIEAALGAMNAHAKELGAGCRADCRAACPFVLVVHDLDMQIDSSLSTLTHVVAKLKRALIAAAFRPASTWTRTTIRSSFLGLAPLLANCSFLAIHLTSSGSS